MNVSRKGLDLVRKNQLRDTTVVKIGTEAIGSKALAVIAGPYQIRSVEHMREIVDALGKDVRILRARCFQSGSASDPFQGLGEIGLQMLREVADRDSRHIITEVFTPEQVAIAGKYVDAFEVNSRDMLSQGFVQALSDATQTVVINRHVATTVEEWLTAAECLMACGNPNIVLCEQGVVATGKHSRFTLDLAAIQAVKTLSHLPVVANPSHAAGDRWLVKQLSMAAIVAGADGLVIEVDYTPIRSFAGCKWSLRPLEEATDGFILNLEEDPAMSRALKDALDFGMYRSLRRSTSSVAQAVGRYSPFVTPPSEGLFGESQWDGLY